MRRTDARRRIWRLFPGGGRRPQRTQQAVEHATNSVNQLGGGNQVLGREVAEGLGDGKQRIKFREGTPRNGEVMHILATMDAGIAFGDICWHRHRGAMHLIAEGEALVVRESGRQFVHEHDKLHRRLPHRETLVIVHLHDISTRLYGLTDPGEKTDLTWSDRIAVACASSSSRRFVGHESIAACVASRKVCYRLPTASRTASPCPTIRSPTIRHRHARTNHPANSTMNSSAATTAAARHWSGAGAN